jgi:hypothetical protein
MLQLRTWAIGLSFAITFAIACDPVDGAHEQRAADITAPAIAELQADPEKVAETLKGQFPGADILVFKFTFADTFALNSAPGGLFAPIPPDIDDFDEDVLANGFIAAFTVSDADGEVIGFGTEQEVLNLANATTKTTFTFTLPLQGTLMLSQREDFSLFLAQVLDMIANNETEREYNPPLVAITTIDGTGRVVGGTEEFTGAKGNMVEIFALSKIDLVQGTLIAESTVVVAAK